ncbi:hypothetical protein RGQ29_021886 [Quercus rubra]|uniref:Uncharacterized protein n=1 Tax=Quercus rubra TaxID=3512 RepID=A0AAN7F1C8_QUERU|nr:hypothetical protein RGQ29_021886 [Quercus rubra]
MAMEPVPMTVGRFWRFLTLGVGLGYTLKLALSGYHDLRNSGSSGGGISRSLTHHTQAEYARGVINKEISKSPTHPQTETTEYSATKDVPPELRLARIHKFIVKNGEAAKSKTLGELAKDLRAFGIGGIWSELAEAKGNEVVKKD